MAKLSIIHREKKRAMLVLKYAQKRQDIKNQLKNTDLEIEQVMLLRKKLQKLIPEIFLDFQLNTTKG